MILLLIYYNFYSGDVDKSKKIVGDTSKLTGNSVYGHSLMDKEKHTSVNFCGLDKATKYINNPYFRNIEEMAGETFEVRDYYCRMLNHFKMYQIQS